MCQRSFGSSGDTQSSGVHGRSPHASSTITSPWDCPIAIPRVPAARADGAVAPAPRAASSGGSRARRGASRQHVACRRSRVARGASERGAGARPAERLGPHGGLCRAGGWAWECGRGWARDHPTAGHALVNPLLAAPVTGRRIRWIRSDDRCEPRISLASSAGERILKGRPCEPRLAGWSDAAWRASPGSVRALGEQDPDAGGPGVQGADAGGPGLHTPTEPRR